MLFSTHYHELTFLSEHLKHLKNIHVSAELKNGNIVFMHKVKDGPTDKSYGIHVAKLAKLPKSIIDRSNEVLDSLEKDKISLNKEYNLFSFEREEEIPQEDYTEVIDELRNLNTDEMSPLEALLKLNEIKDKIK